MTNVAVTEQVPVFRPENLMYSREEKEGYITIRPARHPETNEIVLNITAKQIMKLCDGHRNVGEIIRQIQQSFPGVVPERITRDVYTMLSNMTYLTVLDWTGPNPFHEPHLSDLGQGWSGRIASAEDAPALATFSREAVPPLYQREANPTLPPSYFTQVSIEQALFARSDTYFVLEHEGQLHGVVSLHLPYPYGSRLGTVQLVAVARDCPVREQFLQYTLDMVAVIATTPATGLRAYRHHGRDDQANLDSLLQTVGFAVETVLQDELGYGQDVDVLRYSLRGE